MTTLMVGGLMGCGFVLVGQWWMARSPSLGQRVAPHIRPAGGWGAASTGDKGRGTALERWLPGFFRDGGMGEQWGASRGDAALRLGRGGLMLTVEQFRAQQVIWAVAGVATGLIVALGLAARGSSPVALVLMVAVAGAVGGGARDYALSRTIARREVRMVAELPTVADMLALAVSAGEGALGALERVVRTASGVLVDELRLTLGEVRTGTPLSDALHELADRTGVPALSRFAGGIAIAVERGTPLADVLHSQALDVREAGRRRLIEEGGKREIAMMIPVVFLILPVTVIFAVFPGIIAIRLGT